LVTRVDDTPGRVLNNAEVQLSDRDFNRLRKFIFEHTGISLSDHKRALVYSRLGKRLRFHGLSTYSEYYELVSENDPDGIELVEMINAITTNKTSFFRESHHFDFLADSVFPEFLKSSLDGGNRVLRMWSAGCSTGQEPYTLAMIVREFFGTRSNLDFDILATDIDTNVLNRARQGIYNEEQISDIPVDLLRKYFLKGKDDKAGLAKVGTELQSIVRFDRLNLFDPMWPMKEPLDIIFCRNVIIYFNRDTQRALIKRMVSKLRPGGYLMLGHSESLHGYDHGLQHVKKNVYRYMG
jgi:chemotaxis protein methyltransferase CheR